MFFLFYFLSVAICYIYHKQPLFKIPNPGTWVYWVPFVNTFYGVSKMIRHYGL